MLNRTAILFGGLAVLIFAVLPIITALALAPGRAVIGAFSAEGLAARFRDHGYNSDRIAEHGTAVPRLYVTEFPMGWQDLDPPARRKRLFVQTLLPLILRQNERIGAARARAVRLIGAEKLSRRERSWLQDQAVGYGVEYGEWGRLLRRMNGVPPSLALAQGAIESGWGGSRFARQGNAVFGQWTQSGSGMIPQQRSPGATHKVGKFRNLGRSVAAYMKNINTHPAYARLRATRAEAQAAGRMPSGVELAGMLEGYAETGGEYTELLTQVIENERFERFDLVRLALRPY